MRREQESWKKEECFREKRSRSTKEINKIPTGHIGRTIVVVVFSLSIGRTPSKQVVHCLMWIVGVCFSVERRKRVICCLGKVETK
jgi:hypothetical protein